MKIKRIVSIEKGIEKIKKQLTRFDVFRPGSITQQYSNPEEKTGGFYQLSYSHQGKGKTEYVRRAFIDRMRKQTSDYKEFKRLIDRWVELGIEHSKLTIKLDIEKKG